MPLTAFLFQSTRPMRGATILAYNKSIKRGISIHAPHAGRDTKSSAVYYGADHFNPRAPCGARLGLEVGQLALRQISIHAPHAGRDFGNEVMLPAGFISIHAPHAGRDSKSEQIALHIFAKKAWIPDIFAQNAAFQSVLPLADRQKLLYLRCEPLRKFLRAFASHYKIIGSSGR